MPIASITLERFRNHRRLELGELGQITAIVGPNGSGKTNVLEAIDLLISGRSFRQARTEDVVQWGSKRALVRLVVGREGFLHAVVEELSVDGGRRLTVDGIEKRRRREVFGTEHSVVFRPDDLELVKGSSDARRDALDALGSRLSDAYAHTRREYAKVVRHRNALLREWRATRSDLEVWTEQAVALGARLLVHRRRLLSRLAAHAAAEHEALSSGCALSFEYHDRCGLGATDPAWEIAVEDAKEALRAEFAAREREERERATTVVGPHRDEIVLLLDGKEARRFASQGQQRSVALAWRIGELHTIEDVSGVSPILLLDDVMSELDSRRREALHRCICSASQAFVTTTERAFLPDLGQRSQVIQLGASHG